MSAVKTLTHQRFGRLLVLYRDSNIGGEAGWLCYCDCGETALVRGYHLRAGLTQSCGCLRKERAAIARAAKPTHGMTRTPTHISWSQMWTRCTNPKAPNYKYYGAKGITISYRWWSFENFLADMGERPEGHSLDRKDRKGNYEASNCRWATPKQQANNRNSCRIITYNGLSLNVRQWSEKTGFSHSMILTRLKRGWPPGKTLSTPSRR